MFGLFKKQTQEVEESNAISIEQQIYDEVYSAEEIILKEVNEIIENSKYKKEDCERLSQLGKLGFNSTKDVVDMQVIKNNIAKQERIEYLKNTYPNNKFIDEAAVSRICGKYGLLHAVVGDYIGDIPLKNQNEIINFKILMRDTRFFYDSYSEYKFNHMRGYSRTPYMSEKEFNDKKKEYIPGDCLQILAPIDKLNTKDREIKGYKLLTKDPIVLQPINGGYLIVTSWGLESSDPIVINEKMN